MNMNTNEIKHDRTALRAVILEQYGTIKAFAEVVEMNPRTLAGRLNGNTQFRLSEIRRIRDVMNFTDEEATRYFFPEDAEERDRTRDDIELAKCFLSMTEEQRKLALTVADLCIGNPVRWNFALSWSGPMKDLPAALARI